MRYRLPIVMICCMLAACSERKQQQQAAPPNVLLVVVDTLRADRVNAVRDGKPVMPHLRALGGEGARFTRAISPGSWTKSVMASIFTAQEVYTHRVWYSVEDERVTGNRGMSDVIPEAYETMAESLKQHGYDTHAVQTNANLLQALGFAQGYGEGDYVFRAPSKATDVNAIALAALEEAKAPFFLYVHYMDPHGDYSPPQAHRFTAPDLSEEEKALLPPPVFKRLVKRAVNRELGLPHEEMPEVTPAAQEAFKALYDGECRFLDTQLHQLLSRVQKAHPNTLIIITADHGEELWDHGSMGHGTTVYQELLHVPLIITGPNVRRRSVDTYVNTGNLMPTLFSYLGLPMNPAWQFKLDLLATDLPETPIISRTLGPTRDLNVDIASLIKGGYKFIQSYSHNERMLFSLESDPQELENIAGEHPEIAAEMERFLEQYHRTMRGQQAEETAPAQLTDEQLEELKSMGYLPGE